MTPRDEKNLPSELRYHVIFDTNGILSVKWSDSTICDFKNSFQKDDRLKLELIAFEPVFDEWRKKFTKIVSEMLKAHRDKTEALNKYLAMDLPVAEVSTATIKAKSDDYINKMGLKVVKPDVSTFPTLDFFHRANISHPPFENGDKGFRDAVIATATISHVKANSDHHHLVVCGDKALSAYIEEQLQALTNFRIVSNLEEAGSQLNLALNNLDEQLGDMARERFADFSKNTGIYFDLGIEEKIKDAYESEYPTASSVKEYEKQIQDSLLAPSTPNAHWEVGGITIRPVETTFVGRQGNRLHWESDIGFTTAYSLTPLSADSTLTSPSTVDHDIIYAISWSTEYSTDGYFTNPEIDKIEKLDDTPKYRPSSSFYDSMSKLAALAGYNSTNSGAQIYRWPPQDYDGSKSFGALKTLLGLNLSGKSVEQIEDGVDETQ